MESVQRHGFELKKLLLLVYFSYLVIMSRCMTMNKNCNSLT